MVRLRSVELRQNIPAQTRDDENLTEMHVDITNAQI